MIMLIFVHNVVLIIAKLLQLVVFVVGSFFCLNFFFLSKQKIFSNCQKIFFEIFKY